MDEGAFGIFSTWIEDIYTGALLLKIEWGNWRYPSYRCQVEGFYTFSTFYDEEVWALIELFEEANFDFKAAADPT